jgi:glycosyltransferase involved in cell wall biosynthesis
MRILMLHNSYQQRGGEDQSFESEAAMLRSAGHEVETIHLNNDGINEHAKWSAAVECIWSRQSYRLVSEKLAASAFDVVHVQNFFPRLSPSVYYAAKGHRTPVVQSLRNHRLLCPNGLLFRDGQICESCISKTFKYPGVVKGCYRGSKAGTIAVATMTALHSCIGTWRNAVDKYIAMTESQRAKFIQAGFAAEKIAVKGNFVSPDPGIGRGKGGFALFVGRLSAEKGIDVLLRAWERLGRRVRLKIVGSGPLAEQCAGAAASNPGIEYLGAKPAGEVYDVMGEAQALIFSSECNETFGRTVVEAFAKGTPVIGSKVGSIAELIDNGRTGLHFTPGDAGSLAQQVEWMLARPEEWERMRGEARAEYESKYTAERNYGQLMEIYREAIKAGQAMSRERVGEITPAEAEN